MKVLPAAVVALVVLAATAASSEAGKPSPRLALVPLVTGYDSPVGLAVAPGEPDRLYVLEQDGRVRVVQDGQPLRRPFLDLRGRVRHVGLLGLLALVFDPGYAANRRFYVLYTGYHGREYLVSMRASGGRGQPSTARVLLRATGSPDGYSHVGGQLAFGPDGRLYVGLGDGLDSATAQDLSSPLGKILALDVRAPNPSPVVAAYGLRNPWRFSFDRGDLLYIGDVGGDRWEEIDRVRIRKGAAPINFGWPAFEGPRRSPGVDRPSTATVPPVVSYPHVGKRCRAVIGGYVYRGAVRAARGRYVFGDLCTGHILSFAAAAAPPVALRRELPSLSGLTSFGEDASGTLYATAENGGLYRLSWNGR
jgi:glucose/arabinose dehydrogenase